MITIVAYGTGNIKAISNIYSKLKMPVRLASEPKELLQASKIILPGVGAFDKTMSQLLKSGMKEVLDELVLEKKTPVLGICVGMQILADSSEEGNLSGLSWIKGKVKRIDTTLFNQQTHLPHMGWNQVHAQKTHSLLYGIPFSSRYYFLHSYYFDCESRDNIIATTTYAHEFCSFVGDGHIFGVQFHPEKSHQVGIQLLKNFGQDALC